MKSMSCLGKNSTFSGRRHLPRSGRSFSGTFIQTRGGEGLFENRRQEQREFSYFNLTSVFGVGKLERASERSTEPEINMTVSFRLVVPANARTHIAHAVTLRPGYSL